MPRYASMPHVQNGDIEEKRGQAVGERKMWVKYGSCVVYKGKARLRQRNGGIWCRKTIVNIQKKTKIRQ